MTKQKLYFKIRNTTSVVQSVSLFNITSMFSNSVSGTNTYTWDMTDDINNAAIWGYDFAIALAAPVGTGIYQMYNNNFGGTINTAAKLLTSLNALGLGTFTRVGNIFTLVTSTYLLSSLTVGNVSPAIVPGTQSAQLTASGSLIYAAGYTQGLLGTFAQISLANNFWRNNPGPLDGPYNRSIIRSSTIASVQSMFANVNSTTQKTVYVGFSLMQYLGAFPDAFQLYINNTKIIDLPDQAALTALANSVNTILGTTYDDSTISYSCWFIFPVVFQAGNNLIQAILDSSASDYNIGIEIYDNTAAEIAAATSYGGLNLLYTSLDYTGQDFF